METPAQGRLPNQKATFTMQVERIGGHLTIRVDSPENDEFWLEARLTIRELMTELLKEE